MLRIGDETLFHLCGIGAPPPASDLPIVTMSGRLSPPWNANQRPARPAPVTTSSAIHSAPARRAARAT